MIIGIGTDIIEIDRVRKAVEANERFLKRIFTLSEREYFLKRKMSMETIAGSFAAKEAVVKALGIGIGKVGFSDIEIFRNEKGQPFVVLSDHAKRMLQEYQEMNFMLSISHCKEYAVATAILIR